MKIKTLSILMFPAFLLTFFGCQSEQVDGTMDKPGEVNAPIVSISRIYQIGGNAEVRGFGIVNGLNGTGSSECDPVLKKQLIKYIEVRMEDRTSLDPAKFIESLDTAVVEVYGVIPPLASKGDLFDLRVAPLRNTQTTSLEGGRLYTTKLVGHDTIFNYDQYSKTLARGDGPVFIDKSKKDYDPKKGYVFAGGKVVQQAQIFIDLLDANFYTASVIRNAVNERFGSKVAIAKTPREILINIPEKYQSQKIRFLDMIRTMHVGEGAAAREKRIKMLIHQIATDENKLEAEIALETIGNFALEGLSGLLSHPDEVVRFHAARCMLNIGSDNALPALRQIVQNPASKLRVEAIKALGFSARRNDAASILGSVTGDKDFAVAYAAYEVLRELRDLSVTSRAVAGNFIVDSVFTRGPKRIFASRQSIPRIVIFGDSVSCDRNLFVQHKNGDIIINASGKDEYISISRKHPSRPTMLGPLRSTFHVSDLVRTMGEMPVVPRDSVGRRPGLAIPYDDIIVMLNKMCSTGAIDAEFIEGPLAEFPQLQKRIDEFNKRDKIDNNFETDSNQENTNERQDNVNERRQPKAWEQLLQE